VAIDMQESAVVGRQDRSKDMPAALSEILEDAGARFSWKKYCGFLDLGLDEFKTIQDALLREQLLLLSSSPLWKQIAGRSKISSASELRTQLRITTYEHYDGLLSSKDESALPEPAVIWAYTTTRSGKSKWVPYTQRGYISLVRNVIAATILASAREKGTVNVSTADSILYTIAPAPFLTGHIARGLEQMGFHGLPPDLHDKLGFHGAVAESVKRALHDGANIMISPATVATTVAQRISAMSTSGGHTPFWKGLSDPRMFFRVAKARIAAWLDGRPILPRDLWSLKGLIGWGIDMSILRDRIAQSWGVEPYEFMASTEGGVLALQSWTKKAMTFVPTTAYFEFLPERELIAANRDPEYRAGTVLLDDLNVGERYEVVITSFYGMPFLRYRTGLMIRVLAKENQAEGIKLPQVELVGRSDGLIDLAGFTRLDEKTIWDSLNAVGIEHGEWMARRENRGEESILALYIEMADDSNLQATKDAIHSALRQRDGDYRDVEELLEINPLEIRPLKPGTFEAYRQAAAGDGLERDLAGWIPKTNAPQEIADKLVELSWRTMHRRGDEHRFLR